VIEHLRGLELRLEIIEGQVEPWVSTWGMSEVGSTRDCAFCETFCRTVADIFGTIGHLRENEAQRSENEAQRRENEAQRVQPDCFVYTISYLHVSESNLTR
jgi:hypothetical protein